MTQTYQWLSFVFTVRWQRVLPKQMFVAASETVEWLLSIAGVGAAAALLYMAALVGIRYARIRDDQRSGRH